MTTGIIKNLGWMNAPIACLQGRLHETFSILCHFCVISQKSMWVLCFCNLSQTVNHIELTSIASLPGAVFFSSLLYVSVPCSSVPTETHVQNDTCHHLTLWVTSYSCASGSIS